MTSLSIRTGAGRSVNVPSTALDALAADLRGTLCVAGEPGYDEARTIWNAMIDRRPAADRALRAARPT